ncbi:MAG: CoA-acylating methylmalonate-semialdehyde dehydrogenase [Acidimicrobiales bacterium]|jgi:malonate-semialdehyde dehydrogenase (acetylating)/methylmalonate-semialdehyde dehydrogenase
MTSIPHFVNGERVLVEGESPVYNPATGEVSATVPVPDAAFVDHVVASAREASLAWRDSSLSSRTNILFTFRQLLVQNADELAQLITNEHGKTLPDAHGELARGLENVEYACGLTEHLKGGFSSQVADGVDVHSLREPVGVVAAITPFNFPAMVPLWMSANALATGNAVILKPSERDPSVSVRLGELLLEAGLPKGVFNVLQGNASTVNQLLVHPGIDAISFVGSTPVARHVYETGTAHNKRVQALGGAKNHMVVLPDADLDVAADAAVNAGFGAAGERCMAISVVVAVGDIGDELISKITDRIDKLSVGPGSDPASDFGPVITKEHRDRIVNYVKTAPEDGIQVVRDGTALATTPGFFVGPCLLDGVRPGTKSYDDEIFGPVLGIARAANFADAVALINANPYGNGTAIFTRDGNAARRFSKEVTVGMIGINVPIPVPVSSYSFGGWKNSLFGHAHIYGPEGFTFYTRAKVVTTRWPQPSESQIDLGFPTTR